MVTVCDAVRAVEAGLRNPATFGGPNTDALDATPVSLVENQATMPIAYPGFQFDGGRVVRDLPAVLQTLSDAGVVAETRGFRTAAERCHVSQPSLSAQIAQLEAVLGARLFERDRRHVLVTTAGEELLVYARRVVAEADALVAPPSGRGIRSRGRSVSA